MNRLSLASSATHGQKETPYMVSPKVIRNRHDAMVASIVSIVMSSWTKRFAENC